MSDYMQNTDSDQNFWDDVDSLRDLLEEKEEKPRAEQKPAAEVFYSAPKENAPEINFLESLDPKYQAPPMETAREKKPKPHKPLNYPSANEMRMPPRDPERGLKNALAFLYVILFAECAGLSWLGATWYTWMH